MHLADAFIQSGLQRIHAIHLFQYCIQNRNETYKYKIKLIKYKHKTNYVKLYQHYGIIHYKLL